MGSNKRLWWILTLLLSGVSMLFILHATSRYGVGISHDSVGYVSVADNLVQHGRLVRYENTPYTVQPPLYPLVLAAFDRLTGIPPLTNARFLNVYLQLITIALVSWYLKQYHSSFMGKAILLATAVGIPLFDTAIYAWSEPLFDILVIAALLCLTHYPTRPTPRLLMVAAVLVALAGLTRYVGVFLILTGIIYLWLKQRSWREIIGFGAISSLPLALWLMRNRLLYGSVAGQRFAANRNLLDNSIAYLETFRAWFTPDIPRLYPLASVGLIVGIGILLIIGISQRRQIIWKPVLPSLIFVGIYSLGLLGIASLVRFDEINTRLLAPIYIPVMTIMALPLTALDNLASSLRLRQGIRAGIMLWALFPLVYTGWITLRKAETGAGGFHDEIWADNELGSYLQANPLPESALIYSNRPQGAYFLAGHEARYLPGPNATNLKGNWPVADEAYVIWFSVDEPTTIMPLDELGRVAELSVIAEFSDGKLLIARPAS